MRRETRTRHSVRVIILSPASSCPQGLGVNTLLRGQASVPSVGAAVAAAAAVRPSLRCRWGCGVGDGAARARGAGSNCLARPTTRPGPGMGLVLAGRTHNVLAWGRRRRSQPAALRRTPSRVRAGASRGGRAAPPSEPAAACGRPGTGRRVPPARSDPGPDALAACDSDSEAFAGPGSGSRGPPAQGRTGPPGPVKRLYFGPVARAVSATAESACPGSAPPKAGGLRVGSVRAARAAAPQRCRTGSGPQRTIRVVCGAPSSRARDSPGSVRPAALKGWERDGLDY